MRFRGDPGKETLPAASSGHPDASPYATAPPEHEPTPGDLAATNERFGRHASAQDRSDTGSGTRTNGTYPRNDPGSTSCRNSGAWRCRRGAARARPGSRGRSPCRACRRFGNSTATRRALCGLLDCKDKVDNDGKPTSPKLRSTGSHDFSRASLLESKEPDVMVRQSRERVELPDSIWPVLPTVNPPPPGGPLRRRSPAR